MKRKDGERRKQRIMKGKQTLITHYLTDVKVNFSPAAHLGEGK